MHDFINTLYICVSSQSGIVLRGRKGGGVKWYDERRLCSLFLVDESEIFFSSYLYVFFSLLIPDNGTADQHLTQTLNPTISQHVSNLNLLLLLLFSLFGDFIRHNCMKCLVNAV